MADRIGVINKGEIILVEEKAELMRKLGKKQLTLELQRGLDALPPAAGRLRPRAFAGRNRADLHLRHAGRAHRHHGASQGSRRDRHPLQGPADRSRARSRRSSSAWSGSRHEFPGDPVNLQVRDGAHPAHADAEHPVAGDLDRALFRRLRRGDRLAHRGDRRGHLRRLHRARPDHALAAHPEHLQRLDRHLLPEVHRHDLRAPVGAGLLSRDRDQLCRRGGDQVDHPRPDHSGDVRACSCRCRSCTRS